MSISFLIGFLKIEFVYCSFHGGRASTGFVHLAFCIAMRIARKLFSVSVHTSHFEIQHQCVSVMAQWTIIIVNAGCVYWVHPKPFGMLGSLVDYFCCDTFGLLIVSKMKLYDESPALSATHVAGFDMTSSCCCVRCSSGSRSWLVTFEGVTFNVRRLAKLVEAVVLKRGQAHVS